MNHLVPPSRPAGRTRSHPDRPDGPPNTLDDAAGEALLGTLGDLLPAITARAGALDAAGESPADDVAALGTAGLLLAPLPRALGGRGWGSEPDGALPLMRALRLIGRASLPLGRLFEGHCNTLRLLARHGTPAQCEVAAADARRGVLFGMWNTGDPAGLWLDPAVDGPEGDLVLRGRKCFCSGAGLVERALVTAREGNAPPRMVLVPLPRGTARADLSRWTPTGMRASATGDVDFSGLPAPFGTLIGAPGDYTRQPGFSGGAWRFLAVQLGGIEALAEAVREHLVRTGRGDDPHQAARFGRVATVAETARLWVREAAVLAEDVRPASPGGDATPPERVVAYVDLARGAVERAALDALELAQRSVGLAAMLRPAPVERISRDLATYLRQPFPDGALHGAASAALGFPELVGDQWELSHRARPRAEPA